MNTTNMSSTRDTAADPVGHEPTISDYLLSEDFTSPIPAMGAMGIDPPHGAAPSAPTNAPTAATPAPAPTAALNVPTINNPPAVNNPPAAANPVPVVANAAPAVANYPHTVANPVNQGHVSWRDGRQFATVRGKEARVLTTWGEIIAKIAKDAGKHTQNPPPEIPTDEQRDWTTFYNHLMNVQSYDYTRWTHPQTWSDKLTYARGVLKALRCVSAGTLDRTTFSYDPTGKMRWTADKPTNWNKI